MFISITYFIDAITCAVGTSIINMFTVISIECNLSCRISSYINNFIAILDRCSEAVSANIVVRFVFCLHHFA